MGRVHTVNRVDPGEVIWRYTDFAKFYSLLQKSALYFCPALLLRKSEPFELQVPVAHRDEWRGNTVNQLRGVGYTEEAIAEIIVEASKYTDHSPQWALNCWHRNQIESFAMWKVFVGQPEGVAIKTTFDRVRLAFNEDGGQPVTAGNVHYIDYLRGRYSEQVIAQGYEPIFHKAHFYSYEREFRLGINPHFESLPTEDPDWYERPRTKESLSQKVDLETLIEEVRVSPYAAPWFFEMVEQLVRNTIGPKVIVTKSTVFNTEFLTR
ncbi:hypothetical protein [Noviherbaspirillum sp. Root189]|uniref:hypothetical protein n=1 Tax=Noviherbaspirillum sp. Root189 TaxID=1736487 RepID=UPI00071343C5|nr:hypothetical protein [Noviherbaspirillum sp. Root189]KRB73486.1 hypothetical protein ASE07_06435 [Noviherbaspirillum sp. Root189]